MDCIYEEELNSRINKFKSNIVKKLNCINFTSFDLEQNSDLICMVLDYSPKMIDNPILSNFDNLEKYTLKEESPPRTPIVIPSLLIERKISDLSDDKESKSGSRIANVIQQDIARSRKNSVSLEYYFIQSIIDEMIQNVIFIKNVKKFKFRILLKTVSRLTYSIQKCILICW